MKNIVFVSFLMLMSLFCNGQKGEWYEPQPKGMFFVPQGSYIDRTGEKEKTVTLPAFWISNEITNKEYREFTDYAKTNPDKVLSWIEFVDKNNPAGLTNKNNVTLNEIMNVICVDSLALSKEYEPGSEMYNKYINYFTSKEFDKYPVVGVSYEGAFYYCIWKTTLENDEIKLRDKGLYICDYRIPVKEEMLYAASFCIPRSKENEKVIMKSNYYKEEKLGCCNITNNVSEWTCISYEDEKIITFGSSFMYKSPESGYEEKESTVKSGTIGFRIVRSYGRLKR